MCRSGWRLVAGSLVVFALCTADVVAQGQQEFSLVGTVADTSHAPLPGASVTLKRDDEKRTIITDAQGRFRFTGLLPGTYTVEAALVGFRTRTRQVELWTEQTTHLDMPLSLAALEVVDTIRFTPIEHVENASAIAHVRIATTRVPSRCPDTDEYDVVQDATVLSVLKGDVFGVVELLVYIALPCRAGESPPALQRPLPSQGSEFVVLLHRMEPKTAYGASPETTFPVRNGRVDTHGFNDLPRTMDVESFKAALVGLIR